jgi:hypothetical protein
MKSKSSYIIYRLVPSFGMRGDAEVETAFFKKFLNSNG